MPLLQESISAANPRATLVVLHGYGSNERDLLGLAEHIGLPLEVIAFRAPISLGMGSFAWYNLSFDEQGIRHYNEQESLAAQAMLVEELEALRATRPRLFLAGFSQGCIQSLGIALRRPDLVDAVWLMSGALNPEFVPSSVSAEFLALPKLVQHGTFDPVLPIEFGRGIRDYLVQVGAAHEYLEYPMAHQVSAESLADGVARLSLWLERE
ncbi:MAG: hypothetical protein JNJ45_02410 [Chthonomonas sp.]|nr:hypothetical protein [Chthonomonas sp.]